MSTRIAIADPEGVTVVCFSPRKYPDGLTDEQIEAYLVLKEKQGRVWIRLSNVGPVSDDVDIEGEAQFRNEWKIVGNEIKVDMDKARVVYLEKLRKVRDIALAAKDGLELRAIALRDTEGLQKIRDEKQILRDLPQRILPKLQVAQTPQELVEVKDNGYD